MKIRTAMSAGMVAMFAGMAIAQPTVNGIFDQATEGSFYSDLIWVNGVPTGFGNNAAGMFTGGDFGNPEVVATGVEFSVPLASLGLSGSETIRIAGWVNSGDRSFKANQVVGLLPIDTGNLGGAQDFNAAPFDTTTQHITVDLSTVATGTPIIDGAVDGGVAGASYTNVFLQGNYTGFGNETDGTVDGSGPNGGGSEIDGIYIAKDATNLYIFIAGNLEGNGNAFDLYIDTAPGGASSLGAGLGDGAFIIDGQSGLAFDAGFDADYLLSADAWNHDADDGTTPNVPRAWFGAIGALINDLGSLTGYGAANAGALAGGISMGIDNSNIEGVSGNQSQSTPVTPHADWAYGSELDNARVFIDIPNNRLYLFIAGNLEVNFNKLELFFDCQPGGQNVLLDTNVDISFNGLNGMSGITFDSAFSPDYWLNINAGVDGGSGAVLKFTDASTLRTNGANIDPFLSIITDYGSYDGGDVALYPTIPFEGPRIDIQDGSLGSIFANYGPRLSELDPLNPIPGLINVAINNSNVDGVSDVSAAGAGDVTTGIEISIDLDELGWDGTQDILVTGWIQNAGWDYISNQVLGDFAGPDNIGPRDADSDGINDLDFNLIVGDQFLNLSTPPVPPCLADLNGDGLYNFFDISAFLQAFGAQEAAADFNGDGMYNFFDISAFLQIFGQGCPAI